MQAMTMTTPNNKQQQAETLRQMIHTHFAGVSRQGGISLHQTEVVDAYGSAEEMLSALAQNTDTQWTEVQDGWIEQFGGVGGLCFLDPIGFRYYLPAYMDWFVRKRENSDNINTESLLFSLQRGTVGDTTFDQLLTPAQMTTISAFLDYVAEHDEWLGEMTMNASAAFERWKG
jgi:hypothetical protein